MSDQHIDCRMANKHKKNTSNTRTEVWMDVVVHACAHTCMYAWCLLFRKEWTLAVNIYIHTYVNYSCHVVLVQLYYNIIVILYPSCIAKKKTVYGTCIQYTTFSYVKYSRKTKMQRHSQQCGERLGPLGILVPTPPLLTGRGLHPPNVFSPHERSTSR